MKRYAAIILAAGFSSRMQRFKPLLPVGGETITDHLISTFLSNEVDVYLIAGHRQDELRAGIWSRNIEIIENPDYPQGMFTSIQAGLHNLEGDYPAAFIAPVDIPLVRPFTIKRLIMTAKEHPCKIIYPVFNRKRGHPTLIPAQLFPVILDNKENGGLKPVLQAHESLAVEVNVPDRNILLDLDDAADYAALLENYRRIEIPTPEECEEIWAICQVAPHIRRHCQKVAEVADAIGTALTGTGTNVDPEVIHAAAILHDIAKGQPDHETAGAAILRDMGFGQIAEIVAIHTDLPEGPQPVSLEAKVVYLADKLVNEDIIVPLEERYESSMKRFGRIAEAQENILQRRKLALSIQKEVELLAGQPLEKIILTTP